MQKRGSALLQVLVTVAILGIALGKPPNPGEQDCIQDSPDDVVLILPSPDVLKPGLAEEIHEPAGASAEASHTGDSTQDSEKRPASDRGGLDTPSNAFIYEFPLPIGDSPQDPEKRPASDSGDLEAPFSEFIYELQLPTGDGTDLGEASGDFDRTADSVDDFIDIDILANEILVEGSDLGNILPVVLLTPELIAPVAENMSTALPDPVSTSAAPARVASPQTVESLASPAISVPSALESVSISDNITRPEVSAIATVPAGTDVASPLPSRANGTEESTAGPAEAPDSASAAIQANAVGLLVTHISPAFSQTIDAHPTPPPAYIVTPDCMNNTLAKELKRLSAETSITEEVLVAVNPADNTSFDAAVPLNGFVPMTLPFEEPRSERGSAPPQRNSVIELPKPEAVALPHLSAHTSCSNPICPKHIKRTTTKWTTVPILPISSPSRRSPNTAGSERHVEKEPALLMDLELWDKEEKRASSPSVSRPVAERQVECPMVKFAMVDFDDLPPPSFTLPSPKMSANQPPPVTVYANLQTKLQAQPVSPYAVIGVAAACVVVVGCALWAIKALSRQPMVLKSLPLFDGETKTLGTASEMTLRASVDSLNPLTIDIFS